MDVQLNKEENGVQLTLSFSVPGTKEQVWQLIHTKSGLESWFPELRYENDQEEASFAFVANGITEDLKIIKEEEPYTFSFEWAEAIITFEIRELQEDFVQVTFVEYAPFTFPDLIKDLTSWTLQMIHLKNTIQGLSYTFNQEKFDETELKYRKQIEGISSNN